MRNNFCRIIFCFLALSLSAVRFDASAQISAQQTDDLEFNIDITSNAIPLPRIFKPGIDLSGRGLHHDVTWPQTLAAKETLEAWQKDIGFGQMTRLQYNFWEIQQFPKNRNLRNALLKNYDRVISQITSSGGTVILNIFGTPAGLGKVLDKRSFPVKLKVFKSLVKEQIKNLSCLKRYNIWYEVWSAPDLDDFFLGRRQEYFLLYRAVAEAIRELEAEYKVHIPLGGPGTSWWFQNFESNTIATPENSLIYDLIRFCYRNRLPLDFITWHGYSSDPKAEEQTTIYNAVSVKLIREWLSYFSFDKNTPLIVDEWNFDRGVNLAAGRAEDAFVLASYIPARIKGMYEAGLDYQLFFSLEDFQNNKEGVARNTGIFLFDPDSSGHKGTAKSAYNVYRMLERLGRNMFVGKDLAGDEFVGLIATQDKGYISLILYNYIDPDIAVNYLSRVIGGLSGAQRKALLNLVRTERFNKIMSGEIDVKALRLSGKIKNILKKAKELNDQAQKFKSVARNIKVNIGSLQEKYSYQRYAVDALCVKDCLFTAVEEKEVDPGQYTDTLALTPYSVQLIVLTQKPPETAISAPPPEESNVTGVSVDAAADEQKK